MRGMTPPVLLVVDEDPDVLADLETQLVKRYGARLPGREPGRSERALGRLAELARDGEDVALVLAGRSLSDATGGELLERARQLHPHAKRGLVVPGRLGGPPTAEAILDAMALGLIDYYVPRPAARRRRGVPPGDLQLPARVGDRAAPGPPHRPHRRRGVVGQGVRAAGGLRALRGPARLLPGRLRAGARAARRGGSRGEAPGDGPPRRAGPERPLQRRDRGGCRRADRLRGGRLRRRHRRAQGRRACRRRSTAPPRGCARSSSTRAASAGRPGRAR